MRIAFANACDEFSLCHHFKLYCMVWQNSVAFYAKYIKRYELECTYKLDSTWFYKYCENNEIRWWVDVLGWINVCKAILLINEQTGKTGSNVWI